MRYYVLSIQHNKDADAENRTAPLGFNTLYDAEISYHSILARDMQNSILDWGLCMIINSECAVYRQEKWTKEEEVEPILDIF